MNVHLKITAFHDFHRTVQSTYYDSGFGGPDVQYNTFH